MGLVLANSHDRIRNLATNTAALWLLESGISARRPAKNPYAIALVWAQEGIDENTAGGMEYVEFTDEVQEALYQAGRNNVLPKWVERTGGPDSEAVRIYNEKAAPIVGVRVGADGQAEDIN